MIPKRVTLENFLSFGEPAVEVAFTDDEPLWVLGGKNGVGKSAVFDAMTYCLYGEHRGGAVDHGSLIRHGANALRVVFEFEFDGVDYRILRTRTLAGRPTQRIECRTDGSWAALDLPTGAGRQDPLKIWSERTLGLGFEAFKASVLLRQGEADAIITATGAKRLETLKKIIEAERFEALSKRVHEATRRRKDRLEDLRTRRDAVVPVSEIDLANTQSSVEGLEAVRREARERVAAAGERVGFAKRWADLEPKRHKLQHDLNDADVRSRDASRIRESKARLDDLAAAVPVLRQVVTLREWLTTADERLAELQQKQSALTTERDTLKVAFDQETLKANTHRLAGEEHRREAKRFRDEIERESKFLVTADAVAGLRRQLEQEYPADLNELQAVAAERAGQTSTAATLAGNAKAEASGLLKRAKDLRQSFAAVGVGVTCSRCFQIVTEKHAEEERARLAAEVAALEDQSAMCEQQKVNADREAKAAEAERERLAVACRNRDVTRKMLADKEQTLHGLGVSVEAAELRQQLESKMAAAANEARREAEEAAKQETAAREAARFERDWQARHKELASVETQFQRDSHSLAAERGRLASCRGQLSAAWQAQADLLEPVAVAALENEHQTLADSGVKERFRQLEEDAIRRETWAAQLAEVLTEIAAIPEACQVPTAQAEQEAATARQTASAADHAWEEAKEAYSVLSRRAADFQTLLEEIRLAEREFRLHETLDNHLGKSGLQRELVRTAEREIVRFANDTVRNLSDGDLSIELDNSPEGDNAAFALKVRRADDPTPIGVMYLSGSQKFRVAVAVALAIGRYAAGHSRRLESVIIDEGFGSLDRDGLRATADELNRLRRELRRIILVSHQEEFADRFPVVIRLTQGENGTQAEALRR